MKKPLVLSVLFLSGCIPFAEYYHDLTGGIDITKSTNVILSTNEPKLLRGNNPMNDIRDMLEAGYAWVGYSAFRSSPVNEDGAVFQARRVHASVVFLHSQYTNTVSGYIPVIFPTTQTSSTSFAGNVYSSPFYGSVNTTVHGTSTVYFPINIDQYNYLATYWVKLKPPVLGAYVRDLSPEIRQRFETNKGAIVYAIVKDSPAFLADIIGGDVLKKINGTEIFDAKHFQEILEQHTGKKITVLIWREGKEAVKEVIKEIQLNDKQTP